MKTLVCSENAIHSGNLILVNAQYPYHAEATKNNLTTVGPENAGIMLEHRASTLLSQLINGLGGWEKITPVSGWRSFQEQQQIYDQSLLENGADFTEKFVAKPGHSEHQTGLAIDLGLKKEKIDFIRPDFPYAGICQLFRDKAVEYGFIERYPKGKESITGIAHEPWHFRYIGAPHAAIMTEINLTLEEYHSFLKEFLYGKNSFEFQNGHQRVGISYLKAQINKDTLFEMEDGLPYSISGNNSDGFILTQWKNN
ncbi:MAG: M15 family metallopeptidase [Clostridiaceae bacterium]|nr:M15 family metallopeptidase [Clostridiaceae bacterium]